MDVDRRLERLCERVTLVGGVGSPRRGELCVMSFVALLAGEAHTDRPASASPLIRDVAIPVNDAMPRDVRQRLKPFAARFVGTNDGRERARVEVLRQALAGEVLPRIRRDRAPGRAAERRPVPLGFLFAGAVGRDLEAHATLLLARLEHRVPPGPEPSVGSAMGELLALGMREATTRERRIWWWEEAIGLLDRLCDVGPEPRRQAIPGDRIAWAEERLGRPWLGGIHRLLPAFGRAGAPY